MIKRILKLFIPPALISLYHYLLASLASIIYRQPSRHCIVIGVTGTKGKSTTSYLIAHLLKGLQQRVGLSSTIAFSTGDDEWLNNKKMTMLGRFATQRLLRHMIKNRCTYAVIETSSEGIKQWRHHGIAYDTVVFTNLSPEHIEAHGSFENYRAAKEKLFQHLNASYRKQLNGHTIPKTSILNADDPESQRLQKFAADTHSTFGIKTSNATVSLSDITLTLDGAQFSIAKQRFATKLLGTFNVYNALAAITCVQSLGFSLDDIARVLQTIPPLPGRQEFIEEGQQFRVMVDYAYEPESQRQLYELITSMKPQRIIHVTGSTGGGRDVSRRAELGKIAGTNADVVIVTNEDPYDEDPAKIIAAVAAGARASGKKDKSTLYTIQDRRSAIAKALSLAQPNDLVLITGKGSEQAMCIANGKKIPWDDRRVVREELAKK